MADVAFWVEWNFPLANKHYKKTVELALNNSQAHLKYSQFLLAAEKFDLAIKHIQKYISLEPSGYAIPSIAWIYNMMEDYDVAIKQLKNLETLQPNSFSYHIEEIAHQDSFLLNSGSIAFRFKAEQLGSLKG